MGAGAQFESAFIVKGPNLTANAQLSGLASTYAGLQVQADSVVVDGIYFYCSDATNTPYGLAISDYETHSGSSGHANSGRGCGVFNCEFQGDVNGSSSIYGLGLSGVENAKIAGNHFRYSKRGLTLGGGPNRYANSNVLKDNVFSGCERAIVHQNAAVAENTIEKAMVTDKSTYGFSLVAGLDFTTGAGAHAVFCHVGHATKGTAYVPGTGNVFTACYYTNNLYDGT